MKIKFSKTSTVIWYIFTFLLSADILYRMYRVIFRTEIPFIENLESFFYYSMALAFGTSINDIEGDKPAKNKSFLFAIAITALCDFALKITDYQEDSLPFLYVPLFLMIWLFLYSYMVKSSERKKNIQSKSE